MKNEPMNLTGQQYGKLLVIGYSHKDGNYHVYDCLCDCSKGLDNRPVVRVKGKQLRDGSTQSCGCLKSNFMKELPKDNSSLFSKPEIKELPYYKSIKKIWNTDRSHCNPNHKDAHKSYIEKGIRFSDEWNNGHLGFIFFYVWCIKNNYVAGVSQLNRKDKNLGFSPENCELIDRPKRKNTTKNNETNEAASISLDSKEEIKHDNNDQEIKPVNITNNFYIIDNNKDVVKDLLTKFA